MPPRSVRCRGSTRVLFVAWAAGSAVGYAGNTGGGLLTPLAAVDSLIVSFVVYVLLYSSAVKSDWRRIGST